MCEDCNIAEELKRLPQLLQEKWRSYPLDIVFQVIAREDDLKVRVTLSGDSTITYSCHTADQVVWWLDRILVMTNRN